MKHKRKMIWILGIIVGLFILINIIAYIFTHQKNFGRLPQGDRLEKVKNSPNYRNGEFQNLTRTPQLSEGVKFIDLPIDFLFKKHERVRPVSDIPAVKTDIKKIDPNEAILIWFGHSSYFIQIDEKRILIDPVFCGHASPLSFMMKAFNGSDVYKADDMPDIDYLFITHDHWDHLDYETVTKLKDRIGKVICSLGVGEHFERWGFDMSKVIELDWGNNLDLSDGFLTHCLPTRHFSGRGQKGKQSLWASYLLQTPSLKIYMGGDGGYDTHFAQIGEQFGVIDIALLENGQYNYKWKYIHNSPEQVVQAAIDLKTKSFIPGHSGKFALATHPWDEPLKRVSAAYSESKSNLNEPENLRMLTPIIGEPVYLNDTTQTFTQWWVGLE